ncbi:MAG: putative selenate reductase subunit YgfK [Chloroflexia bacterium]|nr:putative selenate reductase subunit YgfK [Chloroflexia bacterium]
MSDEMRVQTFEFLLDWILAEYQERDSIFGLHRALFYTPSPDDPFAGPMFGQHLATPIGPAAGPHTQLAQNIVCAWLCGGRFIELKTVQVMDELDIPRPCIDMEDEGYNVEWSQELQLEQSAGEYIKAWALIHVLRRLLGREDQPFGTIFNLSVGYDLQGVQSAPMTRFMDRLQDASAEIAAIQDALAARYPRFAGIEIPSRLSNNVTLSTMHGCPPDEIERIARYLLEARGLHTTVKLNPTLLGRECVLGILHDDLGFDEIHIPDSVFEKDLQYERALELIRALQQVAASLGLSFGVKLSNTLAMANHKGTLPGEEMYMSGRPLYPITMNLFLRLAQEFQGQLSVSYSAGADALNVATILAAGARPVTVASDLLKPGGYARLGQYLQRLAETMRERGAASLDELARDRLAHLERAAGEALVDPRYKKAYHPYDLPKVDSPLELFDCITAPCVEQCAVRQDVPEYAWWIARGQYDHALEAILSRNPLPGITGYVCTHLCQTRCTRSNYDQPVGIRRLKRFAAEHGRVALPAAPRRQERVAVVGSGPSGLAAAYFLALNGFPVTIFEARGVPGGMCAIAPSFRLPREVVQADVDRITALGVEIKLSHPVQDPPQSLLEQGFAAVYIAAGFQQDARLGIEGPGVYGALAFLERVARGRPPQLGRQVLVIGGGNTAMDAARSAGRLSGRPVTVVYRRTRAEMPSEPEEIEGLLEEGHHLLELTTPRCVVRRDGRVIGLECLRNRLGESDESGRPRPRPVDGSEFILPAEQIIVAIGQSPDLAFLDGSGASFRRDGAIQVDPDSGQAAPPAVYAGGDAVRGPAIIIEACADGRRAAESICDRFGYTFQSIPLPSGGPQPEDWPRLKQARARREPAQAPPMLPPERRDGFEPIEGTLSPEAAQAEAARCLQCSTLCDKCVEVCPNRANYSYFVPRLRLSLPQLACRDGALVVVGEQSWQVRQSRQIVHVDDFCNECGNCTTFCVHQGRPYADKPRLFLQRNSFERQQDNAFYIEGPSIWRREGGRESRLSLKSGQVHYEDDWVRLGLSSTFQLHEVALKQSFSGTLSLLPAAEMLLLLQGVTASLPL